MDEVLGQRGSTNPPVLIASIPEGTPGPSTEVVDQEVVRQPASSRQRKRDIEDELLDIRYEVAEGGRGKESPGEQGEDGGALPAAGRREERDGVEGAV